MAGTAEARTVLGPLTTTFTPAAACTNLVQECPQCTDAWQAQTCYRSTSDDTVTIGVEDFTDCWPPRASFVPTPIPPLHAWGFYSPGLVCPSGFTSACSATGGGTSDWPVQFGLLEKETAVGCCPSGYHCINPGAQTCIITASSTSFSMVACGPDGSGNAFAFTLPITGASTTISTYSLFAPLIQINFQASDLTTSTTSSASSTSSTFPAQTNTSTSTLSSTSQTSTIANSSTQLPDPGIATGAKAGIAVGVVLGVAAVACLAFYLLSKRKKHVYRPARHVSPTNTSVVYELGAANRGPYATAELPQADQRVELGGGKRFVAELQ